MKISIDNFSSQTELLSRLECEEEFRRRDEFASPRVLRPFIISVEGGLSGAKTDLASSNYCPTPLNNKYYHTNQGITYTTWVHFMGKDRDMAFLKLDQRDWMFVFVNGYWNVGKASQITSQRVANSLVDYIWGSGSWGVKYTQRLLGVSDDGIVGKKTLSAINNSDPYKLSKAINDRREDHFRNIARNIKGQDANLRGWLNRLNKLRKFNEAFG